MGSNIIFEFEKEDFMKKLLVLLAIAMLPACNSRQATQELVELPQQQEVKAQSNQGANTYIEKYMRTMFDSLDRNKDGAITIDELPTTDDNNHTQFSSLDKNKDGKLSLDEFRKSFKAQESMNKDKIRESLAGTANTVSGMDIFKYSTLKRTYDGFMTKEQFVKVSPYLTSEPLGVFYIADKNNDGKLNFSEFEDCVFGLMKGKLDNMNNTNNQELQVSNNNFTPGFKGN